MALPRFVLLKSNTNNKYLHYTKGQGLLRFTYQANEQDRAIPSAEQDSISYPFLKFEVEKSATVEGLVHIRSCYNNKYFVRKSVDTDYITATAHEAEEDQSKLSCTLFKPIFLGTGGTDDEQNIRLMHVCGSRKLSVQASTGEFYLAVVPEESSSVVASDNTHVFTAINVASVVLPDYATFMGHNDKYSSSKDGFWDNGRLSFTSSDVGGYDVANKVKTQVAPWSISLWDRNGSKCWYSMDDGRCVVVSSSDMVQFASKKNNKMHFVPIKIGNYTALKCIDNDRFVACDCHDGHKLSATATSITNTAMLRVGEPVRMREITNATYDVDDSRVYRVTSFEKYMDTRTNYTDKDQEGSFQVKYTTQQSMKWSQSLTVNLGITLSWSFGIPVIESTLEAGISYNHSQTWAWDEEETRAQEITYTQTIKIPPKTKVTLKVMGKRGFCDVPFTCNVSDLMTDGNLIKYNKTDCLYSGCNEFQFDTEIQSEPLPAPTVP